MGILTLSALVMSSILYSGALEVEIFSSPLEVSVNENVLLKCIYSKPGYDLSHVAVHWSYKSQTSQKDLYMFNGGDHNSNRRGAQVFEDALRNGNASLYLPKVQLNEEGNYTCTVYVTPNKGEKTSTMLVSDKPKVNVFMQTEKHGNFTLENNMAKEQEKSKLTGGIIIGIVMLLCVLGFGICIWKKKSKASVNTSQCELRQTEDETCQPLLNNLESQLSKAPTISHIPNPFVVCNGKTTNLRWDVTIPTRVPMEIIIFLKRKIREETLKSQLFHWQLLAEQLHGPQKVTEPLKNMNDSCKEDKSFTADVPDLQRTKEGGFCIPCCIEVQPDISTDNGTELIIEIHPDSLEKVCTSTVLHVTSELNAKPIEAKSSKDAEFTPAKPDEHEKEGEKPDNLNSGENAELNAKPTEAESFNDADVTPAKPVEGESEEEKLTDQNSEENEVLNRGDTEVKGDENPDVTPAKPVERETEEEKLTDQNSEENEVLNRGDTEIKGDEDPGTVPNSKVTPAKLDGHERKEEIPHNQNSGESKESTEAEPAKDAVPNSDVTQTKPEEQEREEKNPNNQNAEKVEGTVPNSKVTPAKLDGHERKEEMPHNQNSGESKESTEAEPAKDAVPNSDVTQTKPEEQEREEKNPNNQNAEKVEDAGSVESCMANVL